MVRALALLALSATGALAALRKAAAPELSSFEMGCYHKAAIPGESGGADGRSYRGLVSMTTSGRTCKKWTDTDKGSNVVADVFDDDGTISWGNGMGNHNYCRNPNTEQTTPWCYTMDPTVEKEECEIKECPGEVRNFQEEATSVATEVAGGLDCKCAAQLYGSSLLQVEMRS